MFKHFFEKQVPQKVSANDKTTSEDTMEPYFAYKNSMVAYKPIYKVTASMRIDEYSYFMEVEKYESKKGTRNGKSEFQLRLESHPNKDRKIKITKTEKIKEVDLNKIIKTQEMNTLYFSVYSFEENVEEMKILIKEALKQYLNERKKIIEEKLDVLARAEFD